MIPRNYCFAYILTVRIPKEWEGTVFTGVSSHFGGGDPDLANRGITPSSQWGGGASPIHLMGYPIWLIGVTPPS